MSRTSRWIETGDARLVAEEFRDFYGKLSKISGKTELAEIISWASKVKEKAAQYDDLCK
jgi:hypothetical protein